MSNERRLQKVVINISDNIYTDFTFSDGAIEKQTLPLTKALEDNPKEYNKMVQLALGNAYQLMQKEVKQTLEL